MPLPAPTLWTDGEDPENYPSADELNFNWRDSWDFLLGFSRPMALLHHTTGSVTIPASPGIAIPFDTEVLKRGGMVHSNVTNNTRLTVPYSGMYDGYLYLGWGTVSTLTSKFVSQLRKNGTTIVAKAGQMGPTILAGSEFHASFAVELAANDYVEFLATSAGSTAPSNTGALNRCKMAMWYEGDAA